jgi:Armadillo/beta-catenin-like repeat
MLNVVHTDNASQLSSERTVSVLLCDVVFALRLRSRSQFRYLCITPCNTHQAATAITNMAHNSDDNRLLIVRAGGVPLILDAMQAFATAARLQRQACWALLTLAALDEVSVRLHTLYKEAV